MSRALHAAPFIRIAIPTCADLWSNACVRCPEALDKLNQMSSACQGDVKKHRVTFAAVNIDDKVKARALVAER